MSVLRTLIKNRHLQVKVVYGRVLTPMRDEDLIDILHHPAVELTRFYLAEIMARYFRLKVRGAHRVPKSGPAIILPNHSGFMGFDAMMICHSLRKRSGRSYKVVAHRAYFDLFQTLRIISQGLGFTEAKLANVQQVLDQGELVLLFPEGESGNFKSSLDRYKLRSFHTGFVRTALQTGAPIIPCIVIGAEESNFNLGNINLNKFINHLVVPLPLNVFPLPAKWTIEFLPPIDLTGVSEDLAHDHEWVRQKTQEIQQMMQHEIDKRLRARRSIYF